MTSAPDKSPSGQIRLTSLDAFLEDVPDDEPISRWRGTILFLATREKSRAVNDALARLVADAKPTAAETETRTREGDGR